MRVVANIKLASQFEEVTSVYVFDDALIQSVDVADNKIQIELLVPIFKGHPDYGGVTRKLKRYFSDSVYLKSDARKVKFVFEGCQAISCSNFDDDADRSSRVSIWEFSQRQQSSLHVEADDIELRFSFERFQVSERKLRT